MSLWTAIQWADSTVNAEMGCDGCELWNPKAGVRICYAGRITEKMTKGGSATLPGWPISFGAPATFPGRIERATRWKDLTGTARPDKPWLDGLPRMIFLNDMGDTFTESLPLDWLAAELPLIGGSRHRWLLLTKRAHRMAEFFRAHRCPENLWLGVSLTDRPSLARAKALVQIDAAVRFFSVEPMWADLDLRPYFRDGVCWAIYGGASGDDASSTDLRWLRHGIEQCRAEGAAPFIKQLGARPVAMAVGGVIGAQGNWPPHVRFKRREPDGCAHLFDVLLRDPKGGDPAEWPEDLRIRECPGDAR